jgi:hypothetical protein
MLGCRPNVDLELNKTFFQEFLQSKIENDNAKTSIEACCDQNSVQIKDHMKLIHFCCKQKMHFGINTQRQENLIKVHFNNMCEFGDSTSST